jgi:hypothetical protein
LAPYKKQVKKKNLPIFLILFVAAAGNAGSNNDTKASYPSNYINDKVIAVAATPSLSGKTAT